MASTHTANVSNLATAAALATVDTEVGVIDGIVDSILVDTAALDGRLTAARGPLLDNLTDLNVYLDRSRLLVGMSSTEVATSTSSTSYVTAGVTHTCPDYSGETYFCQMSFTGGTDSTNQLRFELHGGTNGDQAQDNILQFADDVNENSPCIIQRGGFISDEVITLKIKATADAVWIYGTVGVLLWMETQV